MLLPVAVLFMFLTALLFTALGTAIASTMEDMQGFQLVMNFLIMPIFFLSGSLFPLSGLPAAMQVITRIDPMTYGIDGLRASLGGVANFGLGPDLIILGGITLLLLFIGSYLFSKIQI
jgi:ABC-2 type transport system permease protein